MARGDERNPEKRVRGISAAESFIQIIVTAAKKTHGTNTMERKSNRGI